MSNLDLVIAEEKRLSGLYKRMDSDATLLDYTQQFALMDLRDGTTPLDNVVNVTMNYPVTYVNDLATLISQATIQTVITGVKNGRKMNDKESSTIEKFLEAHYDLIDDDRNEQGLASLMIWLANHITTRGWIAGRYCAWVDKGEYKPDLALWDARYGAYVRGKWASYRTQRLPDEINADAEERGKYGVKIHATVPNGEDEIQCVTFLGDTVEELWAGETLITTWTHNFGYVPAIIQPAPAGFMLRDKGYIQHEGESALFTDRMLFQELNRSVSIEQTLAQKTVMPPYVQEKQDPNAPADPYPDKTAGNTAYNPGETPRLLPVGDFNQAAQLGRRDILEALQQGGRNMDIGNINQPFSAVAIAAVEGLRAKAQIPRLQAIGAFMERLSWMMIDQRKQITRTTRFDEHLGRLGGQRIFKLSDLDGEYSVRYRLMSAKSKEMEIANIAIAGAAKAQGIPDEVIVRDILMAEHPEEILAQMAAQKAEAAEPWIMLARLGHRAIDEAEQLSDDQRDAKLLEAKGLFAKAVMLINPPPIVPADNQEMPKPEKPTGGMNALLPLLGAGNRGNGSPAGVTTGR